MGIDQAFDVSYSAIEANRLALEAINSNIANIGTTRSIDGGPYRRRFVLMEEEPLSFEKMLTKAENRLNSYGGGVHGKIIEDNITPFQKVYNPGHPDADANGFVEMPNVNLAREMVDLVEKSKLYEANITAFNATKKMATDTLSIQ
jgi:flagellar basal-body rod protein FlgC